MCVAIRAFSLWSRRLGGVALVLAMQLANADADAPPTVTELRQAERASGGVLSRVQLPDSLYALPGAGAGAGAGADADAQAPLRAHYRLTVKLAAAPQRLALFVPGLKAHARIHFNGHLLDDSLADPLAPLPRSIARIRLIDIPIEFVRQGDNLLEVDAAGRTLLSLSPITLGPRAALLPRYNMRVLAMVIGPAFVAAVIASLALCVLLLWARRHDALYGYFGLGAMGLALHNAWSLLPSPPLPEVHNIVWWTTLYTFFVTMLVTFCLRFAGWRWRRFELLLAALVLAAAPLLYTAEAGDALAQAHAVWLLGLVGVAAVGLAAVVRYAWTQRNVNGALLLLTAGLSVAFGARDRAVHQLGEDNNPVYLVPYAGLFFAMLVAWMLIDRFVAASRAVELLNRDLEQRVSAKSTELVGAVEAMRAAKEVAEQANRAKTSFLAAASHDLRQPVHALGLYMATLVDAELNPAQLELVQRMKASLGSLDTLFNALLDISRMDAGAVTPRLRAFAPAPLLHRLAEEFAAPAAERGLRLSVRMAPAPPGLHAFSDPVLVEQIVRNLLGNAVKYTRSGGVLLSCRLRSLRGLGGAASSCYWLIEVWDSGPGIHRVDQERVFEEFYQVGNPERDRLAGLGLGLSIVRRLAQLLGHRLALFSRPGRGSRFLLELPCTTEPLPRQLSDGRQDELTGRVVAVIDDDPDVRQGMQLLLERWGCRVLAGADAAEVMRQLEGVTSPLQAIVADYRLRGGQTGVEAINTLRTDCSKAVPALLVSGESSPEQLAQMKASGFACMSKPVRPARLRSWLVDAAGLKA
ncbi:MAG: response regulator [Paucibacter sp.]|nr:response regulator [Roseateles sp.]